MATYLGDKPVKAIMRSKNNLLNAPTILDFSKGIYSQYYFNVDLTGTYTISYFLQGNEVINNAAFLRVTVNGTSKYLAATGGVNRSYSLSIKGHITEIAFINWADFKGAATQIMLNEGDTALPYEPYNLLFTVPIKKCVGKNLLNIFGRTKGDINGSLTNNTNARADMLDESKYYLGWARNNYTNPNAAIMIFNEDNSITGYTKASGYGTAFPVKCKPNTIYTLSLTKSNIYAMIGYVFYDINGVFIKGSETSKNSTLITTPDKCSWIVLIFGYRPKTQGEYTYSNIMFNEGDTALPYEPYKEWYEY